jgi:hypothetical protein
MPLAVNLTEGLIPPPSGVVPNFVDPQSQATVTKFVLGFYLRLWQKLLTVVVLWEHPCHSAPSLRLLPPDFILPLWQWLVLRNIGEGGGRDGGYKGKRRGRGSKGEKK